MSPSRRILWTLLVLFLVTIGPLSLNYIMVAPSEQFYSDASITMMENGDIFTPYFDEDYRFKKPILTYWMVLPAFKIFGVSFWSSRLLFLLAGAATLWFTWKAARMVFDDDLPTAALAVLITATHPLIIFSASRSIPDMPLTLFTTMGIWGVLGILKYSGDRKLFFHLMYSGFALAFATKGAPGLVLGGLAIVYLVFNPKQRISLLKLLYLPALLPALVLGLWWYVLMYQWYGQLFIDGFLGDQVGDRMVQSQFQFLINIGLFLALLLYSLPWNFMIAFRLGKIRNWFQNLDPTMKSAVWLSLIWAAFFLLSAPFLVKFYDRYVLPLVPLAALPMAHLISRVPSKLDRYSAVVPIILFLVSALAALAGFFLTFVNIMPNEYLHWMAVGGSILLVLYYRKLGRDDSQVSLYIRYALPVLAFFFNLGLVAASMNSPNIGTQIARHLKASESFHQKEVVFVEKTKPASKLRIAGHGEFTVRRMADWEEVRSLKPEVIVLRERDVKELPMGYRTDLAATRYPALEFTSLKVLSGQPPLRYLVAYKTN